MTEPFDPYRKWLGIPPKDQPPNHYRLLGIATFENDPDVIDNAATRQMVHVRTFKNSKHAALSQRILTELSAARLCLLTPEQKQTYDVWLRGQLAAAGRLSDSMVLGAAPALNLPPTVPMGIPALPPFAARGDDNRWRMDDDSEPPSLGPPPVPIPMPVGTAVAPVPVIRRSSAAALRAKRSRSALPMALLLISLIVLGSVAGIAALVFGGVLGGEATGRPKNKPGDKSPVRVEKTIERPAGKAPSAGSTDNAAVEKSTDASSDARKSPSTAFPIGTASKSSLPSSAPTTTPDFANSKVPPIDRVRQALFQATDALEARDDDKFVRQITLAEKDLASAGIAESELGSLKEQAQHLRNIQQLSSQFWGTVRENLQNHLPLGEKFTFLKNELTVTSREADVVELSFNGKTQKSTIRELDPIAAALIAARTAKLTEPVTFLPIVAFLSIDGRAMREYPQDSAVKFSRTFFSENKLAGEKNLEIAAKLGLKLAEQLPLGEMK